MKDPTIVRRKVRGALGAGVCLVFAAVLAWAGASLEPSGSSPADATVSASHKFPSHLLLHGVRFDNKPAQLDGGSKAELDYAAELLDANPDMIVFIGQHPAGDPNSGCGLSPTQIRAIASYLEERGIPAARLRLCQAAPSSSG
jgi:outer membrane protein OmpA-like peptidoglycan-associated protein